MVISFAVERDLALSHGVPETVAPAVPVAIDLFMIWAVRSGRDVALSVAVAVAANVAGVLTTESLAAVDTWVSAGLHAVFPLTVWRMHREESAERPSERLMGLSAGIPPPSRLRPLRTAHRAFRIAGRRMTCGSISKTARRTRPRLLRLPLRTFGQPWPFSNLGMAAL
ncbi:hypothetical protein GCM10009601_26860 [Streptomyces thermospinosisporus]|uniref:Uncharacterized protein n=1 Tax=Streptomyces thermospinosisporus TaxID=161482 RepID=A0ABN2Y3B7_9ACTN